jgi:hypothetical protein
MILAAKILYTIFCMIVLLKAIQFAYLGVVWLVCEWDRRAWWPVKSHDEWWGFEEFPINEKAAINLAIAKQDREEAIRSGKING